MITTFLLEIEEETNRKYMESLFLSYQRLMFAIAKEYLPNTEDCQDVVQDALVRLIRHLDTLKRIPETSRPAYIAYTVKNSAINHINHQKVVEKHRARISDDPTVLDRYPQWNPELHSMLLEDLDRLRRIWPRLSERDRLLLEGRYIWGYHDEELARMLCTHPNNIRAYLSRAKKRALKLMEKEADRNAGS